MHPIKKGDSNKIMTPFLNLLDNKCPYCGSNIVPPFSVQWTSKSCFKHDDITSSFLRQTNHDIVLLNQSLQTAYFTDRKNNIAECHDTDLQKHCVSELTSYSQEQTITTQ